MCGGLDKLNKITSIFSPHTHKTTYLQFLNLVSYLTHSSTHCKFYFTIEICVVVFKFSNA